MFAFRKFSHLFNEVNGTSTRSTDLPTLVEAMSPPHISDRNISILSLHVKRKRRKREVRRSKCEKTPLGAFRTGVTQVKCFPEPSFYFSALRTGGRCGKGFALRTKFR